MVQRWMKAQDTFVAQLKDGSSAFVTKGDVLRADHELVKRDQDGSKTLFRPLDTGEDEVPPTKSAPEAGAPKEAVKDAPKVPVRDGRRSSSAGKAP